VTGEVRRRQVPTSGPFPHAAYGAQLCTARRALGDATIWFVGGKDATGRLNDVFAYETREGAWRCVHSNALGVRALGEAPIKREAHSVVCLHDSLWIFGGRSDVGCLDDLHCLDTAGGVAEWKAPQTNGHVPAARELHTAVIIEPTAYMFVVGGLDETGSLAEEVIVLNLYGLSWARLDQGTVPRHTVAAVCVCGSLLTFGGQDIKGNAYNVMQVVDVTTFTQRSCLELNADPTEYVSIKGQGASMGSLRNQFTVEAWVLARSFPPYATIVSKADGGWKTGFGLAKYGAGKGDLEEVPQVNFWLTPGYATTKVQAQIEPFVWTHVAGTYDGHHLRIVINGMVHDTLEFKAEKEEEIEALHHMKADFCIGAHPNKAAWDGMIDEVRLWNVARTDVQIRETMAEPIIGHMPGLVGMWTFNEGAGDLCVDTSGMRNHGTIEGSVSRTLSTRGDKAGRLSNAAERRVEDVISTYNKWKATFEQVRGGVGGSRARAPCRRPYPPRALLSAARRPG
jgi:hypothetical protein